MKTKDEAGYENTTGYPVVFQSFHVPASGTDMVGWLSGYLVK
jgi:hypothetical protein